MHSRCWSVDGVASVSRPAGPMHSFVFDCFIDTELEESKDEMVEKKNQGKNILISYHLCSCLILNASGHTGLQGIFRGRRWCREVRCGGAYQQVHLEAFAAVTHRDLPWALGTVRAWRGGRRAEEKKGGSEWQRRREGLCVS